MNFQSKPVNSHPREWCLLLISHAESGNCFGLQALGSCMARSIDQRGKNLFDEAQRAMLDVVRHERAFRENAAEWVNIHADLTGEQLKTNQAMLIEDTRRWWGTWRRGATRMLHASNALGSSETGVLGNLLSEAMGGLSCLNGILHLSSTSRRVGEQAGDHLLLRGGGVMAFRHLDGHLVSNYPRLNMIEAVRKIQPLIERLELYVEGDAGGRSCWDETGHAETGESGHDEHTRRPMKYEDATKIALAIARAEGWPCRYGRPTVRRMAMRVGCSPHTMSKAMKSSKELRHLYEREMEPVRLRHSELEMLKIEQSRDDQSRFVL